MKGFYTILLLIVSNVFMTFAWYGHLKMKQEYSWFAALPLIGVIASCFLVQVIFARSSMEEPTYPDNSSDLMEVMADVIVLLVWVP